MTVYTVHEPPQKRDEAAPEPERFVFVRDGFSFWAFIFGPLWMLRHRMWLVLLGYVLVVAALEVVLRGLHQPPGVRVTVEILLALLVGLEAGTLRRFTLSRRKWRNVGIVVGDDLESAERRFFDSWAKAEPGASPAVIAPRRPTPPSNPGIIGLFPEPGTPR